MKKAVVLVLDGAGVGEAPDAAEYGDSGSDTIGNTARAVGGLHLPNFQNLGLGNIHPIDGVPPVNSPQASWGKMREKSKGKDSTTGHWEMMGIISSVAMPTFPNGFPESLIEKFSAICHRPILGNRVASGTEIIQELGDEQIRTKGLIVYTSADSVFQIAAHEKVVPPEELYKCCETARKLLVPPDLGVARVIARPFIGTSGNYTRTAGRRDFSIPPPGTTLLDLLKENGINTTGVGKIDDLFNHRSIKTVHTGSNEEGMAILLNQVNEQSFSGFVFANFCDFDSKWGHRNDFQGFASGLEAVDAWLPSLLSAFVPGDILIITADHGNDPTTPSTDHSREYTPLLVYSPTAKGVSLGTRQTFSDIACTLADFFGLRSPFSGTSFLSEVNNDKK